MGRRVEGWGEGRTGEVEGEIEGGKSWEKEEERGRRKEGVVCIQNRLLCLDSGGCALLSCVSVL